MLIFAGMGRIALCLVCALHVLLCRGQAETRVPAPAPGCAAVCVMEVQGRRLLYGYNENDRRQVGGTQHLMTALCVADAGDLDKLVTIESVDCQVSPLRVLRKGVQLSRRELLQVMLIAGGNDAAHALARDCAGDESSFVACMNRKAAELGMRQTCFANSSGLPADQYSTAADMALLACQAYENEVLRPMYAARRYELSLPEGGFRSFRNANRLVRDYPWVKGMKTGYNAFAGKCLVACGVRNDRTVVVVVLGCLPSKVWAESLKYLNWGLGS